MAEDTNGKSDVAKREEEVLAFWNANDIFRKSEEKPAPKGEFVFYDGPPFANGLPHYGHLLAGTIKDAIPRYKTMRGFHVRRRWGWDCHGLPVENLIERELSLKGKKDIVDYGVERFNEAARVSIMKDADAWKKIVPRFGRWVDMESDYKTMDSTYTESVWWAFRRLYDKGLVYEGFKAMQLCPRCGTTLSNFEVNQGYKDIVDFAVTVKFLLKPNQKFGPYTTKDAAYILAWTTTPWTLPGNVALAVGHDIRYTALRIKEQTDLYIVATERVPALFDATEIEIVYNDIHGKDLVGLSYEPVFTYYKDAKLLHKEKTWKVYAADFVTTTDGTGIVHIAPAFGEDDLALANREGLPIIHHVALDGTFKPEVTDFAGMPVKPKDDHQKTDIEIIKHLAHAGLLFKKEKITHSYPHCWRCDTPLLNYASSSWFVKVTAFRDKVVAENKKVKWIPGDIRDGRFGKWLEGARDWAISRSRFWGAPIPVWRAKNGKLFVPGSIEELKKRVQRSGNRYFVMRHGESENNARSLMSSDPHDGFVLTKRGREEVHQMAKTLQSERITRIYTSPFARTRETAEIVADELGIPKTSIVSDDRLQEFDFGDFSGRPFGEYIAYHEAHMQRYADAIPGGESYLDAKKRFCSFLYDVESSQKNENILVISHGIAIEVLEAVVEGADRIESKRILDVLDPKNGAVHRLSFVPLPHNHEYELDLHRPYIDDIELTDERGEKLRRVPEVFDCWFESGSMPYASHHYPFETNSFDPKPGWFRRGKGYPADFIAEGFYQTRGRFYCLIVLGGASFGKAPYRNVIVNGTVLAEDGQKMSKRLRNYPDPMDVVEKYGADAIRYYLLSSPVVRAEDFNFSEKGVGEVMRKNIGRLANVLSFYKLYEKEASGERVQESTQVLDRWIRSRLGELVSSVTAGFESYELERATRPIGEFIDDLSTWYLRRSRDRFRGDDVADRDCALFTLRSVLCELSKTIAPIMPFFAEYLFREVRGATDPESVHLASWSASLAVDKQLLADMNILRTLASVGLEARTKAGLKVRQPLLVLRATDARLRGQEELLALLRDEVNVKEVTFDEKLADPVWLDTTITEELQEEGVFRDIVRAVQDLRKEKNLSPGDPAELLVATEGDMAAFLRRHEEKLKAVTSLRTISYGDTDGERLTFELGTVTLSLR